MKAYIEYVNPVTGTALRVSATREGLRQIRQVAGINAKREYRFRPGSVLAKKLALYVRAERTGTWVNGSTIAKGSVVTRALALAENLTPDELESLPPKGREALEEILSWKSSVSPV